jgi:hypothetical protein
MEELLAMIVRQSGVLLRSVLVPGSLVASLACLVACGPAGPRPARLDASKATAIEVTTVANARRFCPGGESIQLAVAVALTDGKRLDTWSPGESRDGKLPFNVFEYTTTWGQIDGDGFVRLPDDSIAAIGRKVDVEVRVAERPDLVGTVSLEPDFGCGGTLGGLGTAGQSGWNGDGGGDGRSGASGNDTSDGGDGEHGGDAGDGSDGGPGGPGPRVEAAVAYVDTATGQRLAVLRTWADGRTSTTVFDPAGAAWGVVALGGDGGRGGSGGRGGAGGVGGSGTYKTSGSSSSSSGSGSGSDDNKDEGKPGTSGGNGGDGGRGGDGGNGGDGGPGGTIELIYDPAFPELLDKIVIDNRGGRGGGAGYAGDGGYAGSGGSGERRGYDGRAGQPGRGGSPGRDGMTGPRADVHPGDVHELFRDLADRGLTLVTVPPTDASR